MKRNWGSYKAAIPIVSGIAYVPNPLRGFTLLTDDGASSVIRPLRPLLSPRAPEMYTEQLKGVPFNLRILVVGAQEASGDDENEFEEIEAESLDTLARDLAEQTGDHVLAIGAARTIDDDQESPYAAQRGQPERVSPYTAFTVLHRMFDTLIEAEYSRAGLRFGNIIVPGCPVKYADLEQLHEYVNKASNQFAASLVDITKPGAGGIRETVIRRVISAPALTAAGRIGAFNTTEQISADMFALRAKTGRWGYNPTALPDLSGLPVRGDDLPRSLIQVRREYSEAAKTFIDCLIEGLRRTRGGVFRI